MHAGEVFVDEGYFREADGFAGEVGQDAAFLSEVEGELVGTEELASFFIFFVQCLESVFVVA